MQLQHADISRIKKGKTNPPKKMEERSKIPVGPPISNPLPSYWQVPKSPLADVISPEAETPTTSPYDYAIIGSGISGAITAYNLLYPKPSSKATRSWSSSSLSSPTSSSTPPPPRIVLLEARSICSGATGRNGGHTKAASYRTYLQHRDKLGKEEALKIARLEYGNIRATHRLVEQLGIQCDNARCNTVDLVYDQETFDQGKRAIQALREDANEEEKELGGMAWYRIYESKDLAAIKQKFWVRESNTNPSPLIDRDGDGGEEKLVGAFEYVAGRINAYQFTTGLLEKCVREKGLQLCANTPVHSILACTSSSSSPCSARFQVHTQRNVIPAHTVILATNGYTPYILPALQGSIVPLRGQVTAQRPPKDALHPSVLPWTYSFIYKEGYEYMISRNEADGEQHVIIGGGLARLEEGGKAEFGVVDDGRMDDSVSEYLKGTLGGYFGSASATTKEKDEGYGGGGYDVLQEWTGIMGATADGLPFVGEVPGQKGMWIIAGFNGHGMVLCLKSAEALCEMILGSEEEDLEWFPRGFLVTEERIRGSVFKGRTDMNVPETRGASIEGHGCGTAI